MNRGARDWEYKLSVLEKELDILRSKLEVYKDRYNDGIIVSKGYSFKAFAPDATIKTSEVIEVILEHLGLELKYKEPSESRNFELVKKGK